MAETVNIQVIYALPDRQDLKCLALPAGSTLLQALEASGLLAQYGLDVSACKFGIYSKQAKPETILRDRDRVEVYRPLIADPKEVRKARAAQGKTMKKGGSGPKTPA